MLQFLILLYAWCALLWATFAVHMNAKFHPEGVTHWHVISCLFLNLIGFPLAIAIAVFNLSSGRYDKHFAT